MTTFSEPKFSCSDFLSPDMLVLKHHVYEFKKGIRHLVLFTMKKSELDKAVFFLKAKRVDFLVSIVNEKKVNLFFGNPSCIEIVKSFKVESLNRLTPEQDFILGIMLGYSRIQQFARFLKQKALQINPVIKNKPCMEKVVDF